MAMQPISDLAKSRCPPPHTTKRQNYCVYIYIYVLGRGPPPCGGGVGGGVVGWWGGGVVGWWGGGVVGWWLGCGSELV